ncbi:MAG: transketolase [Deltaproteobacteria bacterium]|nr:transketolase [Deltaproteobacteria bacterium]
MESGSSSSVSSGSTTLELNARYSLEETITHMQVVSDMADQLIDIMLNYRQSGHPGGSRSKIRILTALFLSGRMRYDIRRPKFSFNDRFVLGAGHTIPSIYALVSILYEALRLKHRQTGDEAYRFDPHLAILKEDLVGFRRHGSKLPGHAETTTGVIHANTGPSGHGFPIAVGIALALDLAQCPARVWFLEGEGGFTPGGTHETENALWAAQLGKKFIVLEDFNDACIDRIVSEVIPCPPTIQWEAHGWTVREAVEGMELKSILEVLKQLDEDESEAPKIGVFHTLKGREYGVIGPPSHGKPHNLNSPEFWETKKEFQKKYGIRFSGFGEGIDASDEKAIRRQFTENVNVVMGVLERNQELVDFICHSLLAAAMQVPKAAALRVDRKVNAFEDERLRVEHLPSHLFAMPGEKRANREALGLWGQYVNRVTGGKLISFAADLSGSLNIRPISADFGIYNTNNRTGTEFPSVITEFFNSGASAGIASTNFAENPEKSFSGFYAIHGTYGSFVYLGYGPMRVFSQMAQDSPIRVGKVIYLAGHSGPETADDSRTHFGIFSPGVTQLFPEGQIINLVPWEFNEVPVVLSEALQQRAPIIALHLTRPAITIPDRGALGVASHMEARKGAYLIRPYDENAPKMGVVVVQGTSTTDNLLRILPRLRDEGLNVKIVAAVSAELFMLQDEDYRQRIYSQGDRLDSMIITNASRKLMSAWFNPLNEEYALCADRDNRWRTGGTVTEVLAEAQLSEDHILEGIRRFALERKSRLERIKREFDLV